ncbi:hypothetical protein [Riemerella columbina]|uniref:hypothetical protein n=1 Tax=Riemerella columbina TaxID=103810 RepID=UPI00036AD96F|nr:hypothetical protein [Riemerella columbina]
MKFTPYITLVASILLLLFSCNKKEQSLSDLEKLRLNNNKNTYPVTKMDSTQAINAITQQKVQEVLDLSTLYLSGNQDTEIDSTIYKQLLKYFETPDSLTLKHLFTELDSLKVKQAKVHDLSITKETYKRDTINNVAFKVEYFDKGNNSMGIHQREAQYILKSAPEKFKKEFKFYFLSFYPKAENDSTASGVTR